MQRLLKVFDMHFDKGYPAFTIAAELKVNRNTISKDIQFWYQQLSEDWKSSDFDSWLQKELNRLELQRCRLMKHLTGLSYNLRDKIAVEKLILVVDTRILQLIVRTKENYDKKLSYAPKESILKSLPNLVTNHMDFDSNSQKFKTKSSVLVNC